MSPPATSRRSRSAGRGRRHGGTIRRLVRSLAAVVAVILVAVIGVTGIITLRALPQTEGALRVQGLDHSVSVLRDRNGIATILADSPHDLFMAQGYVHAQERMWQMEVWRHISAGRLSELFGAGTLDEDRFIRTLGWRQAAARDLEALSAGARSAVDAYAEGVNAWLAAHSGGLGLGFVVTALRGGGGGGGLGGYQPEPWTALDTLAWQKVQSWQLGGNFDAEVFRMLADNRLGDPALTDALFPAYRSDMPVITPSGQRGSGEPGEAQAGPGGTGHGGPAMPDRPSLTPSEASAWRAVAGLGGDVLRLAGLDAGAGLAGDHGIGSNNWVVGPSLSVTGDALLANDPHLGIGMPSVWFMNGLHCRTVSEACPYDVVGVSFPGVPGIVLGHNARIAWGATNLDPDVQDLFVEELDADGARYRFRGEWQPLEIRRETIAVAGGEEVVIEVRMTRHGPILNDVDPRLAGAPPLALRWTATADVDGTFESIFRLQTAADFEQFRAALEGYGSPAQNFVYADVDGHIGYVFPGHLPVRADPADRGARVRPGNDGRHEWIGAVPYDELPWQLDPPAGLIVSANNAPVDDAYPHFVGADWDPGYRAARILHLLAEASKEGGGVSVEELAEIQLDGRVLRADRVLPHLDGVIPATPDGRLVLERIRDWEGGSGIDSLGCPAYLAFEYRLLRGLFDDELGDLAREYVGGSSSQEAMISMLADPSGSWWDDVTTEGRREDAADVVAAAVDTAGSDLRAAFGDPRDWTWGRVHTATFSEPTLGSSGIGPLEWYFSKGAYPTPGAAGAVNNNYYRPGRGYPDPEDPAYEPAGLAGIFEVTNLSSYRLAIDMGDLDDARIVQTTGQSGNPFDAHYGDLIDDWLEGRSVPLPFTRDALQAAAAKRLELIP